jgi:GNAT superfamily N-acetyltransferase
MTVSPLSNFEIDDAVAVLCDAFQDYPVMRYILGSSRDYQRRLHTLIGYFVAARVFRDEPVLGIRDSNARLVAAAIVSQSGERPGPDALALRREEVWAELGSAERERYEAYGAACAPFVPAALHHHLNMIGVRRSHAGTGLARKLLTAVHQLADNEPNSAGVSLTTEVPQNVPFYEHFGYRIIGKAPVADAYTTWTFFREKAR